MTHLILDSRRAERRAAPKPARRAMCVTVDPARIAVPSGAEAGHIAPSGPNVSDEELRRETQRGLQDRPEPPAFSVAWLGEGRA